jgi:hypothetical protein
MTYHLSSSFLLLLVRSLLTDPRVKIDPLVDLRVPNQAVLSVENPVVLIREVQELRWNAPLLQNVEQHDPLRFWETIVKGVVHHKLGSSPVQDVVDRVPALVVLAVVPESSVELCWSVSR